MKTAKTKHQNARILAVGLPAAGKTSFIAALWEVVDVGEIEGSLRAPLYTSDQSHLNEIRQRWAAAEPPLRTRQGKERWVSMFVAAAEEQPTELFFPDLAGESFLEHWAHRKWTSSYNDLVAAAMGVMLFVHPLHLNDSPTINDVQPAQNELPGVGAGESGPSTMTDPFVPEEAATDPILVDLLQMIGGRAGSPLPIAIIVSAWDLVVNEALLPREWIRVHLPLLSQFLDANADVFPFRVFGVSAHGGDPNLEADRLRRATKPSDRILVAGSDLAPNDISAPVRWLMEWA